MKLSQVVLAGKIFYYRSDDKFVGQRIALGKYEEYETKLFLSQINKEMVVVDVGANIGYYTILAASRAKLVYAFEPDKNCFEILKKNVEVNKLKNVKIFNQAVGDKKQKVGIKTNKENFGDNRINLPKSLSSKGGSRFDKRDLIDCIRLDDLIKEKVDLIKIDVQGWEPEVVEGAKKMISKHRPILFLEYTPSEYKNNKMIEFLKSNYQSIRSIDYWYYLAKKGIWVDKKTGYVDLWIKNKMSLGDYWRSIYFIQLIKIIKPLIKK